LRKFRGYEVKTEGDAFMAAFGAPLDAIIWCLQVQNALLDAKWPSELNHNKSAPQVCNDLNVPLFKGLRVRMGIHNGYPSNRRNPITNRMDYFGPDVNLCARVSNSAHGGQILLTESTVKILKSSENSSWKTQFPSFNFPEIEEVSGKYLYKGIQDPITVYQIFDSNLKDRQNHFPELRTRKFEESVQATPNDSND
jgi:class 3 adenylate cyclase